MSKKKSGILKYTAQDCLSKNLEDEVRCDYHKIAKAIDIINQDIKEYLEYGKTSINIGKTVPTNSKTEHTVFDFILYDCDSYDDIYLSTKEWDIIKNTLVGAGFKITEDADSKHVNLEWGYNES